MCGFVSITCQGKDSESYRTLLQMSLSTTSYRGPDEQNIIHLKNSLIGFNRLAINNLESGKQPLLFKEYCCKNNSLICFNGEIFNYKELEELILTPHIIGTRSRCLQTYSSWSVAIYSR